MTRFIAIVTTCVLFLVGCTSTPALVATGGSRADATVEMSYQYSAFEVPEVDLAQGLTTAVQRCRAWGYQNAEPFGGERRQCNSYYNGGCAQWVGIITYQCLG